MRTYTISVIWTGNYYYTSTDCPLPLILASISYDDLVERIDNIMTNYSRKVKEVLQIADCSFVLQKP